MPKRVRAAASTVSSITRRPLSLATISMPARAIGRTISGMASRRASAAGVQESPSGAASAAGSIPENGQLAAAAGSPGAAIAAAAAGPMRTPSERTIWVSCALVSIAIS